MPRFFSSSTDTSPTRITRAGQAPRTWGRLAALLVLKMVGKGTRTLLDVDVDVVDEVDVLPLRLVTETVMMAPPSLSGYKGYNAI